MTIVNLVRSNTIIFNLQAIFSPCIFQSSSSLSRRGTGVSPSVLPFTLMASWLPESAPVASTATLPASSRAKRAALGWLGCLVVYPVTGQFSSSWEMDSIELAENEKLFPVKTDWVKPLLCRYYILWVNFGGKGMHTAWHEALMLVVVQGRKYESWWKSIFHFFRCTSLRNKYSSCQQLNNGTKENLILPLEQSPGNGTKPRNECLHFPFLPEACPVLDFNGLV